MKTVPVNTGPVKTVCLLTDFGLQDHYVGSLKGVLLEAVPGVQIVDITHNVPPQDVRFGAYQLMASTAFYPPGTLFICIVDPGVGSNRKIIYVEAGGRLFIAPDNGLLSWVLKDNPPGRIIDISNPPNLKKPVSSTFHGRDIMAPVAGRILKGEDPAGLGRKMAEFVRIPFPHVQKTGTLWQGEILAKDGYGNLITNFQSRDIRPLLSASKPWFEFQGQQATVRGLSESYSSVEPGRLLAVEGSNGFVEISVRDGSAAKKTGLKVGDPVQLHFRT